MKKGKKKEHLIGCDEEAHYLGDQRKSQKQDRKRKSLADRSKYKKTDLKKHKTAHIAQENESALATEQEGTVITISAQGFDVESGQKIYSCILKGSLKQEKHQDKNLVTVGDRIIFDPETSVIKKILPRRSELVRQDNITRKKKQLIASNVDQVFITVSVVSPLLKPSIIDRYIISAIKGGMQPIILINKIDLLNDSDMIAQEQKELYEETLKAYKIANVPLISISAVTKEHLSELFNYMKGKISLFAGQSGVGKSSLINAIADQELDVGDVVLRTRKGSHTTTHSRLIPLSFGGFCIDTPGIKSFGIWDLQAEELSSYFAEIDSSKTLCAFNNCEHTHEEGCKIKELVEEEKISPLRYLSYLSLLEELKSGYLKR